jgi:hypothetical protein
MRFTDFQDSLLSGRTDSDVAGNLVPAGNAVACVTTKSPLASRGHACDTASSPLRHFFNI